MVEAIPLGIFIEIEGDAVDRHLVHPDFAGVIPSLEHRQEAKVGKGGPITAMLCENIAAGGGAVQVKDCLALASIAMGIVNQFPFINPVPRNFLGLDALTGHDLADNARSGAPATCAILQMAMERLAAAIYANGQRIWRAPLIQCVLVEESQKEMPIAAPDTEPA
jgi:hypothetical protein